MLENVASVLGKCVFYKEMIGGVINQRVIKVLVEVDLSKGLIVELEIDWGGQVFKKPNYY